MRSFRQLVALLVAVLFAFPAGLAQQEDPRQRIRTTVALVVVPVTVKDSSGQPVLDVRQDEFRIFEDGIEQQIQVFSNQPFPLSAVVLIDNGLPLKTAEQVQQSVRAIAAAFSPFDEVALGLYDLFYIPVTDFTTDNDKLYDQLKRLEVGGTFPGQGSAPMTSAPRVDTSPRPGPAEPRGMQDSRLDKNMDDAIYAAAELLRNRGRDRRKVIFLVSNGENSRHNTHSYDDALKALLSSDISVYAVGVGAATVNRLRDPLARYAHSTGGDLFHATSRADLERLYSTVVEQARNQYTLAYAPSGTNRALDYHSIEVRVRRPNLTLLAREGYFTPVVP